MALSDLQPLDIGHPSNTANMSNAESTHPDPVVVPQEHPEVEKKGLEPVQPAQSPALNKLPGTVSSTVSKADALLLRLSKYAIAAPSNLQRRDLHH